MAIITKIKAGLGNQMFQYAIGRLIADKLNTKLFLDVTGLEGANRYCAHEVLGVHEFKVRFDIPEGPLQEGDFKLHEEKSFKTDSIIYNPIDNLILSGYWQGFEYLRGQLDTLREELVPKTITKEVQEKNNEIASCESLVIHVRGNDYLKYPKFNVVTEKYYKDSIAHILSLGKIDKVFLSTDDVPCLSKLVLPYLPTDLPIEFIDMKPVDTIFTLSKAKYFIIPNSTFSWWSAMLSNRTIEGSITLPNIWFYPDGNTTEHEDVTLNKNIINSKIINI